MKNVGELSNWDESDDTLYKRVFEPNLPDLITTLDSAFDSTFNVY